MSARDEGGEDLAGKVAFITGSARRLGAEIARTLSRAGAAIILHANYSIEDGEAMLAELIQAGGEACLVCGDLSTTEGREGVVNAILNNPMVEAHAGVDLLVNSASIFYPTPLSHLDAKGWRAMFSINCEAPLFLTQALLPSLRSRQGSVVNLVDANHDRPLSGFSAYYASKSSLVSVTRTLALELAPEVRVNGVAPGAILPAPGEENLVDSIAAKVPMGRWGKPEDVANAVLFLATAPYITGEILCVDGGWSLSRD